MENYGEFRDCTQLEAALRDGRKYIEKVLTGVFPSLTEDEIEVHLGWKNSLKWQSLDGLWNSMDNISLAIHINTEFEEECARSVLDGVRKYTNISLPAYVLEKVRDVFAIYSNGSVMVEVEADVDDTDFVKAHDYIYCGLLKMMVQIQNKVEKIVNNYGKV